MKLLFTSDLHGLSSAYQRFAQVLAGAQFDVGVISGDLMTYTDDLRLAEDRCKHTLQKAGKQILFLMGNDDGILGSEWTDEGDIRNLHGRRIEIAGVAFVGYQYTNPFVGGPFEKPESEQAIDLKALESVVDQNTVLVTHGPPYGILDQLPDGRSVGSKPLRTFVDHVNPKLHLFGHVHSSFGVSANSVNGSFPDRRIFISVDLATMTVDQVE